MIEKKGVKGQLCFRKTASLALQPRFLAGPDAKELTPAPRYRNSQKTCIFLFRKKARRQPGVIKRPVYSLDIDADFIPSGNSAQPPLSRMCHVETDICSLGIHQMWLAVRIDRKGKLNRLDTDIACQYLPQQAASGHPGACFLRIAQTFGAQALFIAQEKILCSRDIEAKAPEVNTVRI